MAILIVNNPEEPRGLVMGGRVLIGRRPFNTVMVPDPQVSRIHAWLKERDGQYVLYDAGSRAGTAVNGEPVTKPRVLADGDEIQVGPTVLTYLERDALPDDVGPLETPVPPPAADPYDGGIYFDCACGGPMWVTADLAGATGRCRYCGERLVVPHASGSTARPLAPTTKIGAVARVAAAKRRGAPPAPPAPPVPQARAPVVPAPTVSVPTAPTVMERQTAVDVAKPQAVIGAPTEVAERSEEAAVGAPCSICQTDILESEERTTCPSCHLQFHTQCWEENYGCSAYGCDQVNVLAPAEESSGREPSPRPSPGVPGEGEEAAAGEYVTTAAPAIPPSTFPWDSVLLALSFVALVPGALAFGVPSAIMLVCALLFLMRGRDAGIRRVMVVGALLVSVAGVAAGYATSMLWWKGQRVWETFLR